MLEGVEEGVAVLPGVPYEIVAEEDIKAWNEDERAAAKLQVQTKDAQKIRECSLKFFEWLEQRRWWCAAV